MDHKLETAKRFLNSKGIEIETGNTWLRNCLEWFIQENGPLDHSNEMHNFLYDQLLLADLRDVQLNCLPLNISNVEKIILNGVYTLQVDSIRDVSQSSYSQLQTIRGTGKNLNVENQDPRARNHSDFDNVKAYHMLKLVMTDGVQDIMGMEYETLREIRNGFIPGCKVVINGPVECRLGILFLKSQNFRLLGGELDSIIITNSVENILARMLNLEENPNATPINVLNEISTQSTQQSTQLSTNQNNIISSNNQSNNSSDYIRRNNQPGRINDQLNLRSNNHNDNFIQSVTSNLNNRQTSLSNGNNRRINDNEWPDEDYEEDMEVWNSIETTLNNLSSSSVNVSNSNQNRIRSNQNISSVNSNIPTNSNISKRLLSPDLTNPPKRMLFDEENQIPPDEEILISQTNTIQDNSRSTATISSTSISCLSSFKINPQNAALTSTSSVSTPGISTSSVSTQPSVNRITLAFIKTSPPPLPFSMVVRSCKVISIDKLKLSKDSWSLPAIIGDGTEMLNVDFNDAVISKISTIPAAEIKSKKKEISSDPELKTKIEKNIQNIRAIILKYEGSMKISFTSDQKPNVVSLIN